MKPKDWAEGLRSDGPVAAPARRKPGPRQPGTGQSLGTPSATPSPPPSVPGPSEGGVPAAAPARRRPGARRPASREVWGPEEGREWGGVSRVTPEDPSGDALSEPLAAVGSIPPLSVEAESTGLESSSEGQGADAAGVQAGEGGGEEGKGGGKGSEGTSVFGRLLRQGSGRQSGAPGAATGEEGTKERVHDKGFAPFSFFGGSKDKGSKAKGSTKEKGGWMRAGSVSKSTDSTTKEGPGEVGGIPQDEAQADGAPEAHQEEGAKEEQSKKGPFLRLLSSK